PASELGVPSRLETAGDEGSWQVLSAIDGATLLRPDGSYRLVVRLTAPQPALPLPRTDVAEQQIRFTTAPSPVAIVPADVLEPNWGDPVGFAWSMPMESMTATAAPDVPIAAWIDANDPRRAWVQLGGPDGDGLLDGQTYLVNVTDARAVDGI